MSEHRKTICVDLDGVLADYSKGWQGVTAISDPIPGAQQFLHDLRQLFRVVIYTTRCKLSVNAKEGYTDVLDLKAVVAEWLERNGMEYDDIYVGQGKPLCVAFIDDRAVHCAPQQNDNAYKESLANLKRMLQK